MAKLAKNPLDEVIDLDFGKYWPHCVSKRLKIATILNAGRWGLSYKSLPEEVQALLRHPEVREAWDLWMESTRSLQSRER